MEKKWTEVICLNCKSEFSKRKSEIKRTKMHFCSVGCKKSHQKHFSPKKAPIDYDVKENGCFECTSHKPGKRGYPRMHGRLVYRHVFEEMKGQIPAGMVVRHTCDNQLCINPEHLILGTQAENLNDAFERERMPVGSRRSYAKLNEEQVAEIKRLLEIGKMSCSQIAAMYLVSRGAIKAIKKGATWKHVTVS